MKPVNFKLNIYIGQFMFVFVWDKKIGENTARKIWVKLSAGGSNVVHF